MHGGVTVKAVATTIWTICELQINRLPSRQVKIDVTDGQSK